MLDPVMKTRAISPLRRSAGNLPPGHRIRADHFPPSCDRAGSVSRNDGPTSRSLLLSVVGAPPQDADCGGRDAPKLYLGFSRAMGKSELIPSVVPARDVTPSPRGAGSRGWRARGPGGARGLIIAVIMQLRSPAPKPAADPSPSTRYRTSTSPTGSWRASGSCGRRSGTRQGVGDMRRQTVRPGRPGTRRRTADARAW